MQRIVVASVLGLGLLAVAACGGKGGERAAVAVTGAEVGTVVEVDGEVTASRAGQARPLAVGQRVHDDDVIATGGGRVAIQLDKNHVVWRLGPRLTQQVAQSSAWSAPMAQAELVATTDEHSTAAGRHAEREAADTAASAVEAARNEKAMAPAAPAATAPTPPAPTPTPEVAASPPQPAAAPPPPPSPPKPALDPSAGGVATGGGAPGGGASGGGDRGGAGAGSAPSGPTATTTAADVAPADDRAPDPSADDAVALMQGDGDAAERELRIAPKAPTSDRVGPRMTIGSISTRGPIASAAVRERVVASRAALGVCVDGAPPGRSFTWTFRISATGKVSGTAIKGAGPALVKCVGEVAATWSFPKASKVSTAKVGFTAP